MSDKKSILITGGTGFIGQKLVKAFIGMGHKVYLLSRKPTQNIENQVVTLSWSDIHKQEITSILTQSETSFTWPEKMWVLAGGQKAKNERLSVVGWIRYKYFSIFFKKHNNQLQNIG